MKKAKNAGIKICDQCERAFDVASATSTTDNEVISVFWNKSKIVGRRLRNWKIICEECFKNNMER